jgi:rhodanese-related sulfurtransferase
VSVPTISPHELRDRQAAGETVDLVDVRTPAEFRAAHVAFARNVPLDRLNRAAVGPAGRRVYVVCQTGARGRQACERLVAAGYPDVVHVEGGTGACAAAGLPVVRGKPVMSLERQVRIAAGLLVLLGTVLGWLVHPAVAGLAAFVGAGLVSAGVTDTCGMGLLLARIPWNRGGEPRPACPAR